MNDTRTDPREGQRRNFCVAAVPMSSGPDKKANIAFAVDAIARATGEGAELIVLPEYFNFLGDIDSIAAAAESIPGPSTDAMSEAAAKNGIWLIAGSLAEKSDVLGRAYNTCPIFNPSGTLVDTYRKVHLFDIDLPGRISIRESLSFLPGEKSISVPTPFGRLGVATCFDLRFPEVFRAFVDQDVEIVALPAAFSAQTGPDHWEVLLRARAIENQLHVIAAGQCGEHTPKFSTHGHSMVVDPWGTVLADSQKEISQSALATLSRDRLDQVRRELPALTSYRHTYRPL